MPQRTFRTHARVPSRPIFVISQEKLFEISFRSLELIQDVHSFPRQQSKSMLCVFGHRSSQPFLDRRLSGLDSQHIEQGVFSTRAPVSVGHCGPLPTFI